MVLFFGVWSPDQKGHYTYSPDGRTLYSNQVPSELTGGRFDGGDLGPPGGLKGPQKQGERAHYIVPTTQGLWSVISMWDRTGDSRFNSCAAFLAKGTLTADEVWAKAQEAFPVITKRIEGK